MVNRNLVHVKQKARAMLYRIRNRWRFFSIRLGIIMIFVFLLSQKQFSIQFSIGENANIMASSVVPTDNYSNGETESFEKVYTAGVNPVNWWEDIRNKDVRITEDMNLANAATAVGGALTAEEREKAAEYSNLGLIINPDYAKNHNIPQQIVAYKRQKCLNYIEKYKQTALEEAELYNIPASITIAQGLLESNAGESRLATNDNNHFGIKCKAQCEGCRCANYTDDSKFDMFRVFDTPWYSFREHSKLLNGRRYKHLLQLPKTDYINWAHGLEAAGYATDKQYGEKLIKIIEALELYKLDI